MSAYDRVAADYDRHFQRHIDRWEDERLIGLLATRVNGHNVLDLGCGTGWVLDHLRPRHYVGIDASAAMLATLHEKHPQAHVMKVQIGTPGWERGILIYPDADVVVATWAAHELGDMWDLLRAIGRLTRPGTEVMLHGQGPRYARRHHYVLDGMDGKQGFLAYTPEAVRDACLAVGATILGMHGTGATPDAIAAVKPLWLAGLPAPARYHYAFLAHLRLP